MYNRSSFVMSGMDIYTAPEKSFVYGNIVIFLCASRRIWNHCISTINSRALIPHRSTHSHIQALEASLYIVLLFQTRLAYQTSALIADCGQVSFASHTP